MKNVQRGWAAVARLGGIGDNLIAASTLRPLKRMGYMVEMIAADPEHVIFQHNPFIDKLSVKKKGDIPEGEAWQEWFRGRSGEYDIFANLSHSCEAKHAFFPSQTPFWWRPEYRRQLAAGSYLETVHDIVGVPYEFGPLYFVSEDEKARAAATKSKQMGDKVIAWVLSGSRLDKVNPHAPLVVARVIKELGISVMLVGAPNQRQWTMAKTIEEVVHLHNGSLKGLHVAMTVSGSEPGGGQDWPIRRSLAQLMACDMVVTPDTGMAWAAAFEQMPKVLLVSHASAENIGKHWINTTVLQADQYRVPCHPCHRLHNDPSTCVVSAEGNSSKCMDDISAECLMMAIQSALGNEDARERLHMEWRGNVAQLGNGHA